MDSNRGKHNQEQSINYNVTESKKTISGELGNYSRQNSPAETLSKE